MKAYQILKPLSVISLAISLLSCGGQKTASVEDAEFSSELNRVTDVQVIGSGDSTRIVVAADQELKYNVFKLTDPERVMVDLIDTRLSGSIEEELAGNDIVSRIRVQSIEDSLSTLVRLEVELSSSANYLASFENGALVVQLMTSFDASSDNMATNLSSEPFPNSEEFEPVFDEPLTDESLELPPLGEDFVSEPPMEASPELPLDESPEELPSLSLEIPEDDFDSSAERIEVAPVLPLPTPLPSEDMIELPSAPLLSEPTEELSQDSASVEEPVEPVVETPKVLVEPEGLPVPQIETQDIPTTSFTEGASLVGTIDSRVYTGKRVSLEFQDADIQDVIRLIADVSKLNIIIADDVKGSITLKLVDVPWDQALDIILTSRGLDKVQHGNILRVAPVEALKKEREIALANDKAAKQLEPLRLRLFNINYADAKDMADRIKNLLSERGKVDTDERTNTLIVEDISENLSRVENLVKVLDTQTPQVRIESRIVQANDNFTRSIGIQWGPTLRLDESNGNETGFQFPRTVNVNTVPAPAAGGDDISTPLTFDYAASISEFAVDAAEGTGSGALGLRLGSVSDVFNIDLVLRYAEAEQAAKIVSRPSITVLDNEEASIIQGSRIPFLSTSSEGTQVQFQEAGIEIQVKPQITNDGAVILEVQTKSNEPGSTAVAGNPIINIREASTQLLVKSGNTAVLGGVFRTADVFGTGGVPGLRNLPVLGWLFKGESKNVTRDEMLIFITPYILSDSRPAQISPNSESDLKP